MQRRNVSRLMNKELGRVWKVATAVQFQTVTLCLDGLSKIIKHLGHDAWHLKHEMRQSQHDARPPPPRPDVPKCNVKCVHPDRLLPHRMLWITTLPAAFIQNDHLTCLTYNDPRHTSQTGDKCQSLQILQLRQGCTNPVRPYLVSWHPIFTGAPRTTCFLSPTWRL